MSGQCKTELAALRLLLAEEDDEARHGLKYELHQRGAAVVEARTGLELAHRLIHDGKFSLVITNLHMPWAQGPQVLSAAREAGIKLPSIILSGIGLEPAKNALFALGRVVLLEKPFEFADLLACIRELLPPQLRAATG